MNTTTAPAAASTSPLALLIGCACMIALLSFGIRATFGLFTLPISEAQGWSRDIYALAFAVQNLLWGLGQPFAGALTARFGPARVFAAGAVLYALGLCLMPYSNSPWMIVATAGVMAGLGMAGASYITVLGVLGPRVPEDRRSWALGLCAAAGSLGQFVWAPLGQSIIDAFGWQTALQVLALCSASILLLGLPFGTRPGGGPQLVEPMRRSIARALRDRSYLLLMAGFSVCGFQLAFITVHLPPYLKDVGVTTEVAAWAVGLVGLFNIAGAYLSGVLAARWSPRLILAAIYAVRGVAIVLFVVLPVSTTTVLIFGAVMGLMWLSTVAPTSGLVARRFGIHSMPVLFGLVFFGHQLGSFVGVWLAGLLYTSTGSYVVVWWLSAMLGFASALIHLPIRESALPQATIDSRAARA